MSLRGVSRWPLGLAAGILFLSAVGCSRPDTPDQGKPPPPAEHVATVQQTLSPTCVTIQRGTAGNVHDALITNPPAFQNFGSGDPMSVKQEGARTDEILLSFDISSIPPNVAITSAHAQLHVAPNGDTNPSGINVHQATGAWNESTVTWNSFGQAYNTSVLTTLASDGSFNIVSLVQSWENGSAPNDGLVLEQTGQETNFYSSEDPTVTNRPSLTVCYGCPTGFGDCDNNPANGCETNLQTSTNNCGACGTTCSFANASASCSAGACVLGPCNSGFGNCDGVATNGCETNTNTDAHNCNGCGNVCSFANASASCSAGACQLGACNTGFGNCDGNPANGCETNTNTDAHNCNGCGNVCALSNATSACTSGACTVASCNAGFGNCDGVASNGCEINTNTDPNNCNGCGIACALSNATSACTSGACTVASCNSGFGNCDGVASNGCEVNTSTDPNNCNGCGDVCHLANATSACTAGACTVASCNSGFQNCDGVASDGCEIDTNTDAHNCGGCGVACATGGVCNSGHCACPGSQTVCNGACDDTTSDAANCGGCGIKCAFANAAATCSASTCALGQCNANFGDCDGNPANGCETNLQNSLSNCGACGTVCPTGGTCNAGTCACPSTPSTVMACGGACVDTASDQANCGGCGHACVGTCVASACIPPPVIKITSVTTLPNPQPFQLPSGVWATNQTTVTINGTISEAATVTVGTSPANVTGSTWSAAVTLQQGTNLLVASATLAIADAGPLASGTASVSVLLDTAPPAVTITTPAAGAVITIPSGSTSGSVTVSGTVLDSVVGTVDSQTGMTVTVNGQSAAVSNRAFQATGVPVALGNGTITVVATDSAGNSSSTVIPIVGDSSAKPQILTPFADTVNNQAGTVKTVLASPFTAQVLTSAGTPPQGSTLITFTVTRGDGSLGGQRTVQVPAAADGTAQVTLTLGSHTGAGSDIVQATADGYVGTATFTGTASAASTGTQILAAVSGANQTITAGAAAPIPLTVLVTDTLGNPLKGQGVLFTVTQGSGLVNGTSTATISTDVSGRAFVAFAAGPGIGTNSQIVQATLPGAQAPVPPPATFIATTLQVGQLSDTTISGVALTNENAPIPNVLVTVNVPGSDAGPVGVLGDAGTLPDAGPGVLTDSDGRFAITDLPPGPVQLSVDGTTAGSYPPLTFEYNLTAGVSMVLNRPVYLPLIDSFGVGMANPTTDVVITRPDVPGLVFRVPAGSATFVGSSPSNVGTVQVTRVHRDKIPMTPPDGTIPTVAFAIMPATVRFNPPAPISFPNVDGRAPGEVVTIYSYDHDLGEFVGVGTAQVSADGLQVVSNAGQGIVKGGWHVVPPVNQFALSCPTSTTCGVTFFMNCDGTPLETCVAGSGKCGSATPAQGSCTNMSPLPGDDNQGVQGYSNFLSGNNQSLGAVTFPDCSSALTNQIQPDIFCYGCPQAPTGGSCNNATAQSDCANSMQPLPLLPVPTCIRGYDPLYGFGGAAGQCFAPPSGSSPTANGTTPLCCPTTQICGTPGTGTAVCCASGTTCHLGSPNLCF